ncbi:PSD1 and planctomycete cytochrome C domain-containing protein [Granulicella cerasi]|uniref:PSD1 and planctomycete cytochrome C domain-containing protein n=1 Tax=Granulicella cerasi TaxID=741063 RepID=UPI0037BE85F6
MNGGHAGGFRMDTVPQILAGGDSGSPVVFGSPEKSILSKAIHYSDDTLQMPPKGKLSDEDIAAVDRWIKESAAPIAPADAPTTASATASKPTPAQIASATPVQPVSPSASPSLSAEQEAFFEAKVRPVLVNKCYMCHASAEKGGLRLDSRKALLQGGKDGAVVVPGHPELSTLSSAVHYADPRLQMPPRAPLKPEEVAALDQWIKDGLPWPASADKPAVTTVSAEDRKFWSFMPVVAPAVPDVTSKWAYNDIDRFVLAKLEEKHLKPNGDADKRTLLRRVTYDLTGLPPTTAEMKAFLADKSPQAYEHVVDRLLASPAYGERWGRIWLDVVRYADTTGALGDFPIPQAVKYRDWVIASFNEDMPYDRFLKEQLAGDLMPAANDDEHWKQTIATGYLAGANIADNAQIYDAVDNLGSAMLGMTVSCARCHNHKFDPIPTSDYYALAGIFKSTHFPKAGNDGKRYQSELVLRHPQDAAAPEQVAFQAQLKPIADAIAAVNRLPGTYDDLMPQLQRRRMNLYARAPQFPEMAYAVSDMPAPAKAQIMLHGDPLQLGDEVPRGELQVLGGGALPATTKDSGRLELAAWVASAQNPTTARVFVNRLWQGHFGRGIVATPNNFGTRGVAPSNQALLDYLATQLTSNGWQVKRMQRMMVLSHAYRLSGEANSANNEVDPDNAYIWKHTMVRLDAEEIRDTLLADSGQLDRTPGSTFPFPPQSEWNWEEQNPFVPDLPKYENNKRTVYMMIQRTVKHPYMTLFDGADPAVSTEMRSQSLTPLQALYFMNSKFPKQCSDALAKSLDDEHKKPEARLDAAFEIIYNRAPAAEERKHSEEFLSTMSSKLIATGSTPEAAQQKAFAHLLQAMFSSNEFMFVP